MLRLATTSNPLHSTAYRRGGAVLVLATAVILGALAFQYLGGYAPCPLCLQQRYAYYAAIPVLFVALVLVAARRSSLAAFLFAAAALAFLANAGLAAYHAGAEWKLWAGPETCAAAGGALGTTGGGLLEELENTRVVRCDEPALLIFGLSLAAWNAIICLVLAVGSAAAAIGSIRGRLGA